MTSHPLVWAAAAYLLGAIPFGLLIGLARGIDVRTVGSRNIGATNVLRCVGKPWGILALVCDALKGLAPVLIFARQVESMDPDLARIACACAAVAGHNWPVYLGFKGGKGVATSAGAVIGLAPLLALAGVGIWLAVFLVSRYVSLASLSIAVAVPALAWCQQVRVSGSPALPMALTVLGVLVIARHRANIARLVAGTEHRFDFRRRAATPAPEKPECLSR